MTKESLESFGITSTSPSRRWIIRVTTHRTAAIGRAGQPIEVATAVVFLASVESSYFTAQVSRVELGSSRGPGPQSLAVADTPRDIPLQWRCGVLIVSEPVFREPPSS